MLNAPTPVLCGRLFHALAIRKRPLFVSRRTINDMASHVKTQSSITTVTPLLASQGEAEVRLISRETILFPTRRTTCGFSGGKNEALSLGVETTTRYRGSTEQSLNQTLLKLTALTVAFSSHVGSWGASISSRTSCFRYGL